MVMLTTMAVMLMTMVPRAAASAERIQKVLQTSPGITDPLDPEPLSANGANIEIRNASFQYPGAQDPVLCDVSFNIAPGQVTAVVGGTGSGKTTLLNVLGMRWTGGMGGTVP